MQQRLPLLAAAIEVAAPAVRFSRWPTVGGLNL